MQLSVKVNQFNLKEAEIKLDRWLKAFDKEDVKDYYNDFCFGICYTRKIYYSRANCFVKLLLDTMRNQEISEIIKSSDTVYSYGCGPGPEIAAFVCHLRNRLQQPHKHLKVVAVDRVAYWGYYIREIARLDSRVTVEFRNEELDRSTLAATGPAGVCIMSYPHALGFDDIWLLLKQKFRLVLVLDQGKVALHRFVLNCGYVIETFQYNGQKQYFYHIPRFLYQPTLLPQNINYPLYRMLQANAQPNNVRGRERNDFEIYLIAFTTLLLLQNGNQTR